MSMKWIPQLLLSISLLSPLSAFALFEACRDLFPNQQIPISPQVGRDLCFDGFAVYYSPADKKPIYTVENRKTIEAEVSASLRATGNLFIGEKVLACFKEGKSTERAQQ